MKWNRKCVSAVLALLLILSCATPACASDSREELTKMSLTKEMIDIHKNTYKDLSGRITSRGYSATSVTGTYPGMFPRDSAIDALAMMQYGDNESARKILNYLLTYNQWYGRGFMAHIIDNLQDEDYGNNYLSDPSCFSVSGVYCSQTGADRELYLLNAPNNKAVQPFSVPYNTVSGVRLYLTGTNATDKITVKILTDYRDASAPVAEAEYTFGDNLDGWQTVAFPEPVHLVKNRMYYLEVQAIDSGRVVWKGTNGSGEYQSINYDKIADGGYRTDTGDVTAFELLSEEPEADTSCVFSQTRSEKPLYLLNAPNNKAVQPFTAPFTEIDSVRAYLTSTEDTDSVTVRIMSDYRDDSTVIAEEEFSLEGCTDGWRSFAFSSPVKIPENQRLFLELSAPEGCGKVVWNGSDAVSGYNAVNYDKKAYGSGYLTDSKTTAFQIIPYYSTTEDTVFAKEFFYAVSGKLAGAEISLRAEKAGGNIRVELREKLDGSAVSTAYHPITESGVSHYTLTFEEPAAIEKDKTYYLVASAEGADGESLVMLPSDDDSTRYGNYCCEDGVWQSVQMNFDINPLREIGEIATLGGECYAQQEIPVYSGETITAVRVQLGKKEGADGNVRAELYKLKGTEKLYIDTQTILLEEVTDDSETMFRFGLPLGDYSKEPGNYLIRLSAEDAPENSVVWYGASDSNRFKSVCYDGTEHEIDGELSFTAYCSHITSTCDDARQIDGNYMVVYAWVQLYKAVYGEGTYDQWFVDSYPLIEKLCNYFLKVQNTFNDDLNLIYNPHFEHTRNTQYHKGYDLITNVFASQSLYEMSRIAADMGDAENSEFWADMDRKLVSGIEDTLICEFDGKTIYAEMLGQMVHENGQDYYIKGFSWVNLAPIAADWHAADVEILQNTMEKYRKFGTVDYNGYGMLDACIFLKEDDSGLDLTKGTNGLSRHVIGKGWSWALMFSDQQEDYAYLQELLEFSLAHRPESGVYTENWTQMQPGVISYSDPGNQEHASWQLYAMSTVYPTLSGKYPLDKAALEASLTLAARASEADCTPEQWEALQLAVKQANEILAQDDLLQAEIDLAASDLDAVLQNLPLKLPGDLDGNGKVDVADILTLKNLIMSGKWSSEQLKAGDIDKSGTLDVSDILSVKNIIMNG